MLTPERASSCQKFIEIKERTMISFLQQKHFIKKKEGGMRDNDVKQWNLERQNSRLTLHRTIEMILLD